jgi:hypothetical protein
MAILEQMADSPAASTREYGFCCKRIPTLTPAGSRPERQSHLNKPRARVPITRFSQPVESAQDLATEEDTDSIDDCEPDSKKRKTLGTEEKVDQATCQDPAILSEWHPLFKQDTSKVILLSNDNQKLCVDRITLSYHR